MIQELAGLLGLENKAETKAGKSETMRFQFHVAEAWQGKHPQELWRASTL